MFLDIYKAIQIVVHFAEKTSARRFSRLSRNRTTNCQFYIIIAYCPIEIENYEICVGINYNTVALRTMSLKMEHVVHKPNQTNEDNWDRGYMRLM